MELNSIPKIYAFGSRLNADILDSSVVIEEKVDGSQFSFCYEGGILRCRSKGTVITGDPGMFREAVNTATRLASEGRLANGNVYQCEFVAKPKHNALTYARVPAGNLVLFDVRTPSGDYYTAHETQQVARLLELEPIPVLFRGFVARGPSLDAFLTGFFQTESVLGGAKIEGIVIKNYAKAHPERPGHPMTAKVVSPEFKERMAMRPKNPKAGPGGHVQAIINALRTEARWLKAIQHLRDAGQINSCDSDIGPLVREIQADLFAEETEWIKQQLFDAVKAEIHRGVVQGFAQYYKNILREGMTVFQNEITKSNEQAHQ